MRMVLNRWQDVDLMLADACEWSQVFTLSNINSVLDVSTHGKNEFIYRMAYLLAWWFKLQSWFVADDCTRSRRLAAPCFGTEDLEYWEESPQWTFLKVCLLLFRLWHREIELNNQSSRVEGGTNATQLGEMIIYILTYIIVSWLRIL